MLEAELESVQAGALHTQLRGGEYVSDASDYPGGDLVDTLAGAPHYERAHSHLDRAGRDLFGRSSFSRQAGGGLSGIA
jgi:hypothetical protein